MTRYRLPEALGGMELPEDTGAVREDGMWLLRFDIPDVGRVRVQLEALTEVEPPLPPEPPNFSVVRVGVRPYIRDDDPREAGNWRGEMGRPSWEALCRIAYDCTGFPPVLLVPVETELPEWERELLKGQRDGAT